MPYEDFHPQFEGWYYTISKGGEMVANYRYEAQKEADYEVVEAGRYAWEVYDKWALFLAGVLVPEPDPGHPYDKDSQKRILKVYDDLIARIDGTYLPPELPAAHEFASLQAIRMRNYAAPRGENGPPAGS